MSITHDYLSDPRIRAAVAELQDMIRTHYPATVFTVGEGEDPNGIHIRAVVDVDDPDEVTEVFIDRMIDLQVDDGLPVYVFPVRTPAREAAERQRQQQRNGWAISV